MKAIEVSRDIQAPIERVFDHFTTPSEDKRLDLHEKNVKQYRELGRSPTHLDYEFVFRSFGIQFWGKAHEEFEPLSRSIVYITGGALEGARIDLLFDPIEGGTRVTQVTALPEAVDRPLAHLFGRALVSRIKSITAVHLEEHKRDLEGLPPAHQVTAGGRGGVLGALSFLRLVRAVSLPLIALPLAAGALLAARAVPLSLGRLALTLLGGSLVLFAGNVANDVWDFQKGADHAAQALPEAVLTGSGALLDGTLSPRGAWALVAAMVAIALGCAAVLTPGHPFVPAFAAAAVAGTLLYQAPPFRFSYRGWGLGELCIWAIFGPIAVAGAYYVQAGTVTPEAWRLGAVFGIGAMLVLYCHHFLHWTADQHAGKRSPVAALGPVAAARLGVAIVAAYAAATALLARSLGISWVPTAFATLAVLALLVRPLWDVARGATERSLTLLPKAFLAYLAATGVVTVALMAS